MHPQTMPNLIGRALNLISGGSGRGILVDETFYFASCQRFGNVMVKGY